jgi:transcriptional regulator with XRE-family HTH domain
MPKRGWRHVDSPQAVGRRLKEARLAAGMSQRELSFPGCTAVYICRIERGDRVPSLQLLRELARRLGVDEEYLATGAAHVDEVDGLLEADVALRLDQRDLAEHLYTRMLAQSGDRVRRACALAGLGEIDLHAGRLDEAVERLEESRRLLGDALADYPGFVDVLARAYRLRSQFDEAIGLLEDALALARERPVEPAEARFSILLASALIDGGNLASARELLGRSLAKATASVDPILQARLYWSQSRLHSAEANVDAASHYARMALAAIELTENAAYAARAHQLLADVELQRGNAQEALDLIDRGRRSRFAPAAATRTAPSKSCGRRRSPSSAATRRQSRARCNSPVPPGAGPTSQGAPTPWRRTCSRRETTGPGRSSSTSSRRS